MDYFDLLKDKRWAIKRQKILKRDNFKCTVCGAKENLVVHHTYYCDIYDYPWSYPDESLLTLCGNCHQTYHETHEIEIRQTPPKVSIRKKHKSKRNTDIPKDKYTDISKWDKNRLQEEANRLLGKKKKYRPR